MGGWTILLILALGRIAADAQAATNRLVTGDTTDAFVEKVYAMFEPLVTNHAIPAGLLRSALAYFVALSNSGWNFYTEPMPDIAANVPGASTATPETLMLLKRLALAHGVQLPAAVQALIDALCADQAIICR
jgi:hypothetical protein